MNRVATAERATVLRWSSVRVSGTLTKATHLVFTTGAPPHALLHLEFAPVHGLPYLATIDFGDQATAQAVAQAELPHLAAGAVVSVGGQALELRADHGTAALRVVGACDLVIAEA